MFRIQRIGICAKCGAHLRIRRRDRLQSREVMKIMLGRLLLFLVVCTAVFLSRPGRHWPLDPDEPVAADGSMSAGRARTIFQFEPALGAFDEPKIPDPDDPAHFVPYFQLLKTSIDSGRTFVRGFLSTPPRLICEEAMHQGLIFAIHRYYGDRGVQKANFTRYGPNAAAFIESALATDADQQIDESVRELFVAGYLSKTELQGDRYPELEKILGSARPSERRCTG